MEVFAGEAADVAISGHVSRHQGVEFEWLTLTLTLTLTRHVSRHQGVEFEWRRRALSFYT